MLFPVPTVIATAGTAAAAARLASFLLSLSSLATRLQVDEQLRVVVAAVAAPLFALSVPARGGRGRALLPTAGFLICAYLSRSLRLRCDGGKITDFATGGRGLYAVSLSHEIFT